MIDWAIQAMHITTAAAHLHFGIYTMGGAIDPLLFWQTVSLKKSASTFPSNNNFITVLR
jgi:hypothetical protein